MNAATLDLESLPNRDETDGAVYYCGPYSPGWGRALGRVYADLTWERDGQASVRRAMRRMRRDRARETGIPMRIQVFVKSTASDYSTWYVDPESMEVYGWRAALTAIRALRKEGMTYPDGEYVPVEVTVTDARLDALRESDGWDDYLPPI